MSLRRALILALVALAAGPLCFVAFAGDRGGPSRAPSRAMTNRPAVASASSTVDEGCVDRVLAYGLTDDQALGEQYDREFLSPLVAHPPLPEPGFYPPGHAPEQAALFHALYHGYVVVRYQRALAAVIRRDLRTAVRRAPQPVVVVAATGMPFAAGALVYGRTSICGKLSRTTVTQLAAWIESARPRYR